MLYLRPLANSQPIKPVPDKFKPGIFVKLSVTQLNSPTIMNTILNDEVAVTAQIRGIKVVGEWGDIESIDGGTGLRVYDWSSIDDNYNKIAAMDDKHMVVAIPWREFFPDTRGVTRILPPDLQTDSGIDGATGVKNYDYAWKGVNSEAVQLKLWDPVVLDRLEHFIKKMSQRYDKLEFFNQVATLETAMGGEPEIPIPGMTGDQALDAQEEGHIKVMRMIKKYWGWTPFVAGTNFRRSHVQNIVSILEAEKMGFGVPNNNNDPELIWPNAPKGAMLYAPDLSGKVIIALEIQNDEFQSTLGKSGLGSPDYPTPAYLMALCRQRGNNYTFILRVEDPWLTGLNGNESMFHHIQNDPIINAASDNSGGFNNISPTSLL